MAKPVGFAMQVLRWITSDREQFSSLLVLIQ
jgi:hypothetical protein